MAQIFMDMTVHFLQWCVNGTDIYGYLCHWHTILKVHSHVDDNGINWWKSINICDIIIQYRNVST